MIFLNRTTANYYLLTQLAELALLPSPLVHLDLSCDMMQKIGGESLCPADRFSRTVPYFYTVQHTHLSSTISVAFSTKSLLCDKSSDNISIAIVEYY